MLRYKLAIFCLIIGIEVTLRITVDSWYVVIAFPFGSLAGFMLVPAWQRHAWALLFVGALCNMLVVVSNRGMPVMGDVFVRGDDIWIFAEEWHRFPWLMDRFGGFSVGDFVMVTGLVLLIPSYLVWRIRERTEERGDA